jgi:uncharacterized membrane protein YdjX (TVP38/TMEM64 family)
LVILRLAPVPFNILNLVCAGLPDVTLHHFAAALSVVSFRVVLTLYIANTVSDIASRESGPGTGSQRTKWIELGMSIVFLLIFISASTLFYYRTKKRWDAQNQDPPVPSGSVLPVYYALQEPSHDPAEP